MRELSVMYDRKGIRAKMIATVQIQHPLAAALLTEDFRNIRR